MTGSKGAPRVTADFHVRDGGFRQFKYQTFGGTVAYSGSDLTIDTRLQQNPTQWMTAKGTLPASLAEARYVKVQQGVGDRGLTNVILEYELTRWLRLQTNVLQNSATQQTVFRRVQDSGADLIFFFSF